MHNRKVIGFICIYLLVCLCSDAQSISNSSGKLSVDPPYADNKRVYQQVNYQLPKSLRGRLHVQCYQESATDSLLLYDLSFNVDCKQGINKVLLDFEKNDQLFGINYDFMDLMKRFELLPPGKYVFNIYYKAIDTNLAIYHHQVLSIDSSLAYGSSLRGDVNQYLNQNAKKQRTDNLSRFAVKKGVSSITVDRNGLKYNAFYYKNWFLGYYEIGKDSKATFSKVATEKDAFSKLPGRYVNANLEGFPSLSSEIKKLEKQDQKDGVSGIVDLTGGFGNGQDPSSKQDNNYAELRGELHADVLNMPVVLEGYYTTQDENRKAKASYIRVHYDAEKAKERLSQNISSYKNKYNEVQSNYGAAFVLLSQLMTTAKAEEHDALHEFAKTYGLNGDLLKNSNGNAEDLAAKINVKQIIKRDVHDTATESDVEQTRKRIIEDKNQIAKRYADVQASEKKIQKYRGLIEQYKNQKYFDSALSYSKINDADLNSETTYKRLAKSAEGILPPGKVSRFITGLTRLDIGILNSYESSYTSAGQTLKGGSAGYDLGFAEVGVSLGKTEYATRDGNIDRYNSYLGRVNFRSVYKQHFSLIYYGYAPTRQIITDKNFIKSDAGEASFMNPVHILSLVYSGSISKNIIAEGEAAASYKKTEQPEKLGKENAAVKASVAYALPFYPMTIKGEWEHVGQDFENSVLPYTKAATERYTLASQASLFKSFISIGLQYNFVKQESFYSAGYNTRWGFDIKTNSKRYPTIMLSYKPFSTFRRYDDTFSIQQRPLVGSIVIARGSYQIKKGYVTHRIMLTYNQNNSSQDTIAYNSKTIQASYIMTSKKNSITSNIGWMAQPVIPASAGNGNLYFVNAGYNRKLNKQLDISVGQDIAFARSIIERTASTIGFNYSLKKLPVNVRIQCRYTNYELQDVSSAMQNLWMGLVGVNWRFIEKK